MAKFLDTQGVSYYLKQLIDDAKDKLYLISPYLQLNNQLKLALADRAKFRIDIILIYGKVADLNPEDSEWLQSLPDIKLLFHKDLHAKCYFNEKEAIITSMNLYMFSQQNNVEMGIYVSKDEDQALYEQIHKEVDKIKRGSEHRTISIQKVEKKDEKGKQNDQRDAKAPTQYFSATALSKELGINTKELFSTLEKFQWIKRKNDDWELTSVGRNKGAQIKKGQYGEYIAWPDSIISEIIKK